MAPMSPYGHYGGGNPVMSNVHHPGAPLSMVGGGGGGMATMSYGNHHIPSFMGQVRPAVTPAQDRPFRCDECPQSFNRNHDLKRHKRIHLAVKPFPCGNCDKSFSRKDALKRHKLVKGCGEKKTDDANEANSHLANGSGRDAKEESPPDPNDAMSMDSEDSPRAIKQE